MAKYLKLFDEHTDYETFIASQDFITPNVSYCVQENEVHFNPYDPYNGYEYIEIGGLKWATMNVGANSVTDGGLYFQWGDTQGYIASQVGSGEGKKYFGWEDYKYGNGSYREGNPSKYNSTDGLTTLEQSDDAAQYAWGGNWRIPTKDDFTALSAAATSTWVTDYNGSGVSGIVITSNADSNKTLFLPAYGGLYRGNFVSPTEGCYSSSSLGSSVDHTSATVLTFKSNSVQWNIEQARAKGFLIRPVAD